MASLEQYQERGLPLSVSYSLAVQDEEFSKDQEKSASAVRGWSERYWLDFKSRLQAFENTIK